MANSSKTVVLAYSGGLDTTCILFWLKEQGYNVICYTADIGQDDDFNKIHDYAIKLGASKVIIDNRNDELVNQFIFPSLAYGGIYQGRYLLGTSLARPCIAKGMVLAAKKENANFVSHGATGKGNDQVRFELSCASLDPTIKCIAPWRMPEFYERFQGRMDLVKYAAAKGFHVDATVEKPFSMDANIMHISYESGVLENPGNSYPDGMLQMSNPPSKYPSKSDILKIRIRNGYAYEVINIGDESVHKGGLNILQYLNKLGGQHGVGVIDIVEDRYIGLKSRGIYETPGSTILFEAIRDLEVCCLDKEVNKIRAYLVGLFADHVYNGYWFSPECAFVRSCLDKCRKMINGQVLVEIFAGKIIIKSREAERTLYDQELVSMDVQGNFIPIDVGGFIRTQSMRLHTFRNTYPINPFTEQDWSE